VAVLDVLCVGSATADTIALVPHPLAEDERLVADGFAAVLDRERMASPSRITS
jgi:hypothetical protein